MLFCINLLQSYFRGVGGEWERETVYWFWRVGYDAEFPQQSTGAPFLLLNVRAEATRKGEYAAGAGGQCRFWGVYLEVDAANDLVLAVVDILCGWAGDTGAAAVTAGGLSEIAAYGPLTGGESFLDNMVSFLVFSVGGVALNPRGAFVSQNSGVVFDTLELK